VSSRRAFAIGAGVGLLILLGLHAWRSYSARLRPARPSPEIGAWLDGTGGGQAVWIAHPHQTLARLERRVGDLRRWLASVGLPGATRLPRFGPFTLPPSKELAVRSSPDGRRFAVALRTYRTVGVLARLAGRLAGNPWLRGGDVRLGREASGRVTWRRGLWTLEAGLEGPGEAADVAPTRREPALARFRLGRARYGLPGGEIRVVVEGSELWALLGEAPTLRVPVTEGAVPPIGWRFRREGADAVRGVAIWEGSSSVPPIPPLVQFLRGIDDRDEGRLPGEALLRFAGRRPAEAGTVTFRLRALDDEALLPAASFALAMGGVLDGRPDLVEVAGGDPAAMRRAARRVADETAALPLGALLGVDPERLVALLAPWDDCGASLLERWTGPDRLRWRLCAGTAKP